jgi:ubiquinone/menaquinone biosynthesis C-methylase UbiE
MISEKNDVLTATDYEMAPSLGEGAISEHARRMILSSRRVPQSNQASMIKAQAVVDVFSAIESCAERGEDPIVKLQRVFQSISEEFERLSGSQDTATNNITESRESYSSVEEETGQHYSNLFTPFSDFNFFEEARNLLEIRLTRNGVSPNYLEGKKVLDSGCGGGRYTVALKLLGAGQVVGVDVSPQNVLKATERVASACISGVQFQECNVLDLPFENNSFDFVFSNGVLHHTSDWRSGVSELMRVLKPGGDGWLYLIENPGGLFWDSIEVLRVLMRDQVSADTAKILKVCGIPANRIFYMLDHVMVPINIRLRKAEIEEALRVAGGADIQWLQRGTDFDRVEYIYNKRPFARELYGEGEQRCLFSKPK